jgi:hypothetical protein
MRDANLLAFSIHPASDNPDLLPVTKQQMLLPCRNTADPYAIWQTQFRKHTLCGTSVITTAASSSSG